MRFNNESIVEALTPFEPGFRKKTRENILISNPVNE